MSVTVRELERVARVAPFGVRFRDPVTRTVIDDGLRVSLASAAHPGRAVEAHPNRVGIYVIHDAPGLGQTTFGAGDDRYWDTLPHRPHYRCTVSDTQGRFHGVHFEVALPCRGLFSPSCDVASPPAPDASVDLFSTPARSLPGAMAIVRGELQRADTGAPAAFALIHLEYLGVTLGRGVSDRVGRFVVACPYPEPERRPRRSPPESASPPTTGGTLMQWDVHLRVFHDAALVEDETPDYCRLLAQPEGRLLQQLSPPVEAGPTTIVLGREFVYPAPDNATLFVASA